jgi:hypothetical protein
MSGLAQLHLAESPWRPPELDGLSLVTLFIAIDGGVPLPPDDRPNGDGWELRVYRSTDELVDTAGPAFDGVRPNVLRWELVDDWPGYDDLLNEVDADELDPVLDGREPEDVIGATVEGGAKLGGWPTIIQSEIYWAAHNEHPADPIFCLEIDSAPDLGLHLWDGGVLHIGAGRLDGQRVWVAESQSM